MLKGVKVPVAFGEYVVPPVSLRMHFDHEADLDTIADPQTPPKEWTRAAMRFVLAVLRRNYPEITEEQFCETAAAADLGPLIVAAKNQSGYTQGPLDAGSGANVSAEPRSSDTSSTQPAGSQTTSSTG